MLIQREYYLEKIRPFVGKGVIKAITGQRRAGKSSLLKILCNEITQKKVDPETSIYINKELHEFDCIRSFSDLIAYVEDKNSEKRQCQLFIDEIQDIENFEKALRHFQAVGLYDIYCTGSNSTLLSGELATLLSGRFIELRIYTLTYKEFLIFHNLESSSQSLELYFKFGGLPFLRNIELREDIVREYIAGIYKTVLLEDVIERYNVRNPQFLEKLAQFCADNIGSLVSAKSISDYLKSQGTKITPNTVMDYLDYFVNTCLMLKASRYDLKGRRILEIGEKYYFEDIGIRNYISGQKITNIHKVLENVVYHHLKASGYTVSIGTLGNLEIDFVGEKNGEKIYVQVCYQLQSEDTLEREFGNLKKIPDNYPKYVISMDPQFGGSVQGIKHLKVENFLLQFPFEG